MAVLSAEPVLENQEYGDPSDIEAGPITTPVWLTGLWLALFIIRPWEELFPELAAIRFERFYALTVLVVVLGSGLGRFDGSSQTNAVLLFLSALTISSINAYDSSLAWVVLYIYITLVVFYFTLLWVIRSPHQLIFIIVCYVVTMALYLGKAEWEYFVHGKHQFTMGVSRMLGIESTFGAPNSVASSTVLSLPFLQFLWWRRHDVTKSWSPFLQRWFPPFLVVYFLMAIMAIILTNSRSGAVGFLLFLILFGKLRPEVRKNTKRLLYVVLALVALWQIMPQTTKDRFKTLWDPDSGRADAKGSADGRKESFLAGWAMFLQEPLTGVGIGNTALYRGKFIDGKYVSPHNFYGELLGETGLIGTAAFIYLLVKLLANVRATKALARSSFHPTIAMLSELATSCSYVIVLLLVSGLAGDSMLRFQWLWLAAFCLLARNLSESIIQ